MLRSPLLTPIVMTFLLVAGQSSGEKPHAHLPKLDQVKEYFQEHKASLDSVFDLYAADENLDWVECDRYGLHRVTSFSAGEAFQPSKPQSQVLQEICADLRIRLIQRVDSGLSVIWQDIDTKQRRFRIELYRTDHSYEDTCATEEFEYSISSCMVPLDTRWGARYFWLPHN